MSSTAQFCAIESKSTTFNHLWKIHNFKEEVGQWKSEVFYGYSSHGSGSEVSWHYVLDVEENENYDSYYRRCHASEYSGTLGTVIDACSTSLDVAVQLEDHEGKISGKTKAGSTLGSTQSINVETFLNEETLTFRLKFTLTEDSVPQDSQLVDNYMSLITNKDLSDVTIQVGPVKFYAQKAILSVRSPVFAAMFQSGMKEAKLNHLTVEDIDPEVFKELLRFIYVGKVERLQDMAHELLAAADKYALDSLRTICDRHLVNYIEKGSVLKTLALADLYHAEELKKQATQFICKNIKSMKETDWMSYNSTHPRLVAEILAAMTIN